LRAYTRASIGGNAIRLRRDSDSGEQDFVTITGGGLDLASITSFKGAANLFVTKLYDQTGGGRDLIQATAANQPAFILAALGSNPVIRFDGAGSGHALTQSGNITQAQPITFSVAMKRTAVAGGNQIGIGATSGGILTGGRAG